ncbi:MAG: hypothetical protein KDD92_00875 [Caldilineaceae bacterium]|nr:hypothetical protein [Caldilineaceae bacterium]
MCAQTLLDLHAMQPDALAAGKLPPALLAHLLANLPTDDPALLLGPAVGEDAAVIDFTPGQNRLLVAKSDPITFATDEIGYYAVNVCANDLAVTGATPRFYFPTLLLPPGASDPTEIENIFTQIGRACRELNVVIGGGHSEITPAVRQPVVAGTLLGEVARDRYVHSGGSQIGDLVLLVGAVPVEGASIIAREKRDELTAMGWSHDELDEAAGYLFDPGISVLKVAHAAAATGQVHAMHDPTEGGVATALLEMAVAADVGLDIDLDAIHTPPRMGRLCTAFGLDPLGTIASGALLATARPEALPALEAAWSPLGRRVSVIGRVLSGKDGLRARRGSVPAPFPRFDVDEITKLFE